MPNQASERLHRNINTIMTAWEQRATAEVLAALNLESLALRDSLPELLRQIVDRLSVTVDRTSVRLAWDRQESERVGRQHGFERANGYYTMDQMIFEYHILRQVICDVMEEEAPLSPVDREVIVCAIEQAVNDAATQFSETLKDIQEELATAVTHDLRGPITSARINAQLLLRRPTDPAYCIRTATRIVNNMARLEVMIVDLLDISTVRAGQPLSLQRESCDLELLALEVAEEMNITYGNRFVVEPRVPATGMWSPTKLRRVLENLTANAAKYGTPNTPITLSLAQDPTHVTLRVHNDGPAILPDQRAHLFTRFGRSRTAGKQVGWGLGLTVVKGLVEAHHGTVKVESATGQGTLFVVVLPRQQPARE